MKVRIYLSKEGYKEKPDKSASIIKTVSSYNITDIEIKDLYDKLINGHFIHAECGFNKSNTGSGYYTFKKALLEQTSILCVDLDYKLRETKPGGEVIEKQYSDKEMPEWTNELLSDLKYINTGGQEVDVTPTFWMESFSAHKKTDKKTVANSVHLFYVFEDPIYDVNTFEKVAVSVIYAIYNALKNKGYNIPLERERCPFDPVSKDMFQGLWGSYGKKHNFNGNTYFWDVFENAYMPEFKDFIFQKNNEEIEVLTDDEIKRTIEAYSCVKTLDDIDISKCRYLKYKQYFGHEEGFHIMSTLKHEYSQIEDDVNSKDSLCYLICKKLLLGHCNDFFDNNENNFYREYRRCKIYSKKSNTLQKGEAAYMEHTVRLIGDTGAIPLIEYKEQYNEIKNTIKLDKNQYLSDKKGEILSLMNKDNINFLIAEPGLGKTVFAKSLRGTTLIIELFNSIIQSEEKFSSEEFAKFYGSNYIKRSTIKRLNVCSANKFVSWNEQNNTGIGDDQYCFDKCIFDNIILDESHLLCLSNYRYDIMGKTVQYIKLLKQIYPDVNIILMTGTPFGEDVIFKDMLNTIKILTEPRYIKTFHMIQTSSIPTYMKELIKDSLEKGLRIFIPVDSENWFDTFIEECIDEGIITKDRTYYFNQPKHIEETEIMILNTKQIGNIDILGTSSYMSVGIDLEDWRTEFVTIIPMGASQSGNFSGLEVEQFANRHRKQNLDVYYVISKNESYNKEPMLCNSWRAIFNIKNDLIKTMYETNPVVIHIPAYMSADNGALSINQDMYDIFIYYKDMKPYISHPKIVYKYMESIGWKCDWQTVDHPERGLDTKEHKEEEKAKGTAEFLRLLKEWSESFYPIIKVNDNIQSEFKIVKNKSKDSLFDIDSIEVDFTSYYAKNILFAVLLNVRGYLTGKGTYNLIMDSLKSNGTMNMAFIDRTLHAIKIINNFNKTGIWETISDELGAFYNNYSDISNPVYKDNKDEFYYKRDKIIQKIWDSLTAKVCDDVLRLALNQNYNNVTKVLIDEFMNGVKLVSTMYLQKKQVMRKIKGKTTKVTLYSWDKNALSRYEIRTDKGLFKN